MYSLRMSFWIVPLISRGRHALLLGHQLVQQQQDRAGGVDRHARRDRVERDVGEQHPHVGERVDGDADLADLALGSGMIAVVAHLRRQIERARQAGLAGTEQELEALVGRRRPCRSRRTGAWSTTWCGTSSGTRRACTAACPVHRGARPDPTRQVVGPVEGLDLDARIRALVVAHRHERTTPTKAALMSSDDRRLPSSTPGRASAGTVTRVLAAR